jgi:hypothetical protein
MIFRFALITLMTFLNCVASDDWLIQTTAEKFATNRSMTDDLIAQSKKSDTEQTILYLQVGRQLLCNLLEKNPIRNNLKEYNYNVEVNDVGQSLSTMAAGIQILSNNELAFFWKFKGQPVLHFYYNNLLYKLSAKFLFSDFAVSPDNKFICSIGDDWKVAVWSLPKQPRGEIQEDESLNKAIIQKTEQFAHLFDVQWIDPD